MNPNSRKSFGLLGIVLIVGAIWFAWRGTAEPEMENMHSADLVPPRPAGKLQLKDMSLEELEAADQRGDLLGEFGTETPEKLLYDITELRAEPFAPLVLDKLQGALPKLESARDRVRAAALLHRYGRQAGTDYLRQELQRGSGPSAFPIVATLTMARDEEVLPILVEGLDRFAGHLEFTRAAGAWSHPALLKQARTLPDHPNAPRGMVAIILAMAGDQAAAPLLTKLIADTAELNPMRLTYRAALARLEPGEPHELIQTMEKIANDPSRFTPFLSDNALLLGPEHARSFVEDIVNTYTKRRLVFGEEYEEHAKRMQAGTGSERDLPSYPRMEQGRMLEAVAVLQEWKIPATAELIYRALEASQTGRYSLLLNRQLMAAAIQINPTGSQEEFLRMGLPPAEIEAAEQLARLKPVAGEFLPHQKSISLTRESRPLPAY